MDLNEYNRFKENQEQITVFLTFTHQNLLRLSKIESLDEAQLRKVSGFFNFHTFQCMYIVCIELCKLYHDSNNQKWNYLKLFRRFKNERHGRDFMEIIEANGQGRDEGTIGYDNTIGSIQELSDEVDVYEDRITGYADLIRDIKELRDTIYAHSDGNYNLTASLSVNDLTPLVTLSSEIYNQIHGKIERAETNFSGAFVADINEVIDIGIERMKYVDLQYDLYTLLDDNNVDIAKIKERINQGIQ